MSNGFVGNLTTVTSERTRALRRERENDDRERQEREQSRQMAPVLAAQAELNETYRQLAAVEREVKINEWRKTMSSPTGPTFPEWAESVPKYDYRFDDPDGNPIATMRAIEQAVTLAGKTILSEWGVNDRDNNFVMLVRFINRHAPQIDVTNVGCWRSAWSKICEEFAEFEKSLEPAPEPVAEVTPVAPEDRTAADLQRQIDVLPIGNSRKRERLERLLHRHQIKKELLLDNKNFRNVMLSICDDSGLEIPAKVNLQFIDFLKSPAAREYQQGLKSSDLDEYAMSLRLAFSQFTATDSWLSVPEKQEQVRRRNIASYSAENIKQIVGSTNTFGYDPGRLRQ
jgi:hypothetical protein